MLKKLVILSNVTHTGFCNYKYLAYDVKNKKPGCFCKERMQIFMIHKIATDTERIWQTFLQKSHGDWYAFTNFTYIIFIKQEELVLIKSTSVFKILVWI